MDIEKIKKAKTKIIGKKIEYYKEINEDDIQKVDKAKYGITIVKTEYKKDNLEVETKNIKYITNDEKEEDRILSIFKENKVTPINSEEVISDIWGHPFSPINFI